ncbi:uncharacterized protein LOC128228275 [Mya arenaria]|uniref:uncharacterized protein LOC128228275 n=1 Tax=Mya arenaria TaxID=6604 RepID=UPI0022E823C7|nr:uncharacterized protein LOC128228275 [Mya arenaria]
MGISLQQWRAKIGTFSKQLIKNKAVLGSRILQLQGLSLSIRIFLFFILLAQCVEPNPGPSKLRKMGSHPQLFLSLYNSDLQPNQEALNEALPGYSNHKMWQLKEEENDGFLAQKPFVQDRMFADKKQTRDIKRDQHKQMAEQRQTQKRAQKTAPPWKERDRQPTKHYGGLGDRKVAYKEEASDYQWDSEDDEFDEPDDIEEINVKDLGVEVSRQLCKVMEGIGVSEEMVKRRRMTHLVRERVQTDYSRILHAKNVEWFYFGSQSEGSTTMGMESDTDMMVFDYDCPVVLQVPEKDPEKVFLLAIKTEDMPAQHCYLQMFYPGTRKPVTEDFVHRNPDVAEYHDGKVLLKNTWENKRLRRLWGEEYFQQQGPSRSGWKDVDVVSSFNCAELPAVCKYLFERERPGHWPRPEVLKKAKTLGTTVMPQGFPGSSNKDIEWRFSTSKTERLLMFDLNIVQLRTYTLLKLIRKSRFAEHVQDRLSSFHIKTAVLFTVEKYPSDKWQDDNITECVLHCLRTLQDFLKSRTCPHYTIRGVNLFAGKLSTQEQQKLEGMISDMLNNPMAIFIGIRHDRIQTRLMNIEKNDSVNETAQYCLEKYAAMYKSVEVKKGFVSVIKCDPENDKLHEISEEIKNIMSIIFNDKIPNKVLKEILKLRCCFLGSVRASFYIGNKWKFPDDINIPYAVSLDADLTSCRLKFASMLYCSGQLKLAEQVLAHVESLLHPNVWQCCGCGKELQPELDPPDGLKKEIMNLHKHDIETCIQEIGPTNLHGDDNEPHIPKMESPILPAHDTGSEPTTMPVARLPMTEMQGSLDIPEIDLFKSNVALSVRFNTLEIHCVPQHLVEFVTPIIQPVKPLDDWLSDIIVDSIPFLHYLQYLTYWKLIDEDFENTEHEDLCRKKQAALDKLSHYVSEEIEGPMRRGEGKKGHTDTAFSMLSHCHRLEGNRTLYRRYKFSSGDHS